MSILRASGVATLSMTCADMVCQRLERGDDAGDTPVDLERTLRMATTGAFVAGPTTAVFFKLAERFFPGTGLLAVCQKTLFDVTTAPARISGTFASVTVLSGGGLPEITSKLSQDLYATWATGACIFPPMIFGVFKFVPLTHRAPLWAVVGGFWNVYLSYVANRKVTAVMH